MRLIHLRQLRGWLARFFGFFSRKRREREFTEELEGHLSMNIEDNLRAGMSPQEARRQALIKLGGVTLTKEMRREQVGLPILETLWQDMRFSAQMLLKQPGFTLIAALTLALGIGANTSIFSVVYAVLIKPLPYHEPDRLVVLWTKQDKIGVEQSLVSEPELQDFREQAKLFEGFGMLNGGSYALTGQGEPEQLLGAEISDNFLDLFGVRVIAGRDFTPADEQPGAPRVALLSYGLWLRRFGGERSVIGGAITLAEKPTTAIGVLPPDFKLMLPSETQEATNLDVWTPYIWDAIRHTRPHRTLTVIGRMKPGVTLPQAQAEMNALAARLAPEHYTRTGFAVKVVSLSDDLVKKQRPVLLLLLGAVGLVLLIACANVANLLLARAASREKEIAVRAALGASRARIIRQLMTESLLLALLGGALGSLLAVWGVHSLAAVGPADFPRLNEVGVNFQVLAFSCFISTLTGILFGLFPALRASKTNLTQSLKDGSRNLAGATSQRMRGAIVVTQIALSLLLLAGAGLLLRSFLKLTEVDPGFSARNVLTMKLNPPRAKYKDGVAVVNFYQQLLARLRSLPGVEAAAAVNNPPLSNESSKGRLTFEGVTGAAEQGDLASAEVDQSAVTPDYFRVMRTPLLAGRFFTLQDTRESPRVAIIDERLARRFWPNANPIGRRLTFGRFPEKVETWVEIVGVVKRIRHHQLDADVREHVYFPHTQSAKIQMTLALRATSDPLAMSGAVRQAVQSLDPDQPVFLIRTMNDALAGALAPARFTLLLLLLFAGVAALLAAVGIYGVMAHSVAQRTREIGVRVALGAQVRDVSRLVIWQGLRLAFAGIGLGLVAAFVSARILKTQLFEVSATDPLTFAGITALLLVVTVMACWIPARRATKVDPLIALRSE